MIRDNADLAGIYFAPTSSLGTYRMRKPDGEFIDFAVGLDGHSLVSAEGWSGRLDDEKAAISNRPAAGEKRIELKFKNGALCEVAAGGRCEPVEFTKSVSYPEAAFPEIWTKAGSASNGGEMWAGNGRLRLWYNSPNQLGAVLVPLLLVTLWASAKTRIHVFLRLFCMLALGAETVLLILTKSRGSAIAAAAAICVLAACTVMRGRMGTGLGLKSRAALIAAATALFICAAGLVAYRTAFSDEVKGSDSHRVEMLSAGLSMLRDAPGGWGNPAQVGLAYTMWYAPLGHAAGIQRNLVNEHFTSIVALGWGKGAVYLFVWVFPLFLLLGFAKKGGNPLPAAIWTALNISCVFNVVLGVWSVWLIPVASLSLLAFDRRWLSRGFLLRTAKWSLAAVMFALASVFIATRFAPESDPRLRMRGNVLTVGAEVPHIILIYDGQSLGGVSMPLDLRHALEVQPEMPTVEIVSGTDEIPSIAGKHLILVGKTGDELMHRLATVPYLKLPSSITFIAPTFPPTRIPGKILKTCKTRYIIGEFAARYIKELEKPPSWVEIVHGAEVYIPSWMAYLND